VTLHRLLLTFVGINSLLLSACEEPNLEGGRELYGYYCAGCHKDEGTGNFLRGVPEIKQTDLTPHHLTDHILGLKRERAEDSKMPSFDFLKREQAEQISRFLIHELGQR